MQRCVFKELNKLSVWLKCCHWRSRWVIDRKMAVLRCKKYVKGNVYNCIFIRFIYKISLLVNYIIFRDGGNLFMYVFWSPDYIFQVRSSFYRLTRLYELSITHPISDTIFHFLHVIKLPAPDKIHHPKCGNTKTQRPGYMAYCGVNSLFIKQ